MTPDEGPERESIGNGEHAVDTVDITERAARKQELVELKERFEAYVSSSLDIVTVVDEAGVVSYVSPAIERLIGYDPEEFIGECVFEHIHPDDVEAVWTTFTNVVSAPERERARIEYRFQHANGSWIWLESVGSNHRNTSLDGFVINSRQITQRKTYEERIARQRDNLELLNEILRHDVRNDLMVIDGYCDLLREHIDDEGAEMLEVIQEVANDSIRLTRTARELSSVMLDDAPPVAELSLTEMIEAQMANLQSAHPEAVIHTDRLPAIRIQANDMLESVFRNLLWNAIQHNDSNTPTIWIDVETTDDTATVTIADNGPGIPAKKKADIFEDEANLKSGGNGLGLYLVQALVEWHGGTVSVADNHPRGTTFIVRLPRRTN